ncbi:hypothetical protein [Corallococcus carmarthensis]|uniref:Uncharacterized protein n=1 Tax=Corallococcus carmarthensis TaxID=2316728 RepID=A0A3A8JRS8_9BACT|nr:hypothetical protein [Corallococcus carmarthensis]RKG97668.1 hypothetical protein D7X32_32045 [Corallococcus carmarthensis]
MLAALATTMDMHLLPFVEDAVQRAMVFTGKDVKEAAFALSGSLRSVFLRLRRQEHASRYPTAGALELELRGQIARLGPYSAAYAVKEVETALFEGGEAMAELNLLEDEGASSRPFRCGVRTPSARSRARCAVRTRRRQSRDRAPCACHGGNSRRLDAADLHPWAVVHVRWVPG